MVCWNFYINNHPIFHSFSIDFSKSASAKQGSSPGVTSPKTLTVVKVSVSIPEKAAASQRPNLKSSFRKDTYGRNKLRPTTQLSFWFLPKQHASTLVGHVQAKYM
jgi:hypothetical protein